MIISNGNFEDHLNKVKIVLNKLKTDAFKINGELLFFARYNFEYLGFQITRLGKMHIPDKVQVIKHIAIPTNKSYSEA